VTPSAESVAGGVGVLLHKFKNKKYKKDLLYNVNHGIIKANKEPPSTAKEGRRMKRLFEQKIARMKNETILEILSHHADTLHDWRNWGNNIERIVAEEAYKRGLID